MSGKKRAIPGILRRAAAALTVIASPATLYAQSCAMCYQSAAASGQRGYFTTSNLSCSTGATIAVTIAAGPLNYVGVDPMISCNWPTPST